MKNTLQRKNVRLATADYCFPLLTWPQAVRLVADLGFEGIDVSVFQGRSHLRPEEVLAKPSLWGETVRRTLAESDLAVADIFGIAGANFEEAAPNHPHRAQRILAREFFERLLEFAARSGAKHLTMLPGIHFESETEEDSLMRCAEELQWRTLAARDTGIRFAVEAHTGSILSTPALAQKLLGLVPELTLTLDPGHFVRGGVPDSEILPLLK